MNFRDLVIDDYDELLVLWEKAGGIYRPNGRDSREKIAEELEKDTAIFLVAETDGSIVGTVFGTHDGRKGWINRLAISPDYRFQGIASQLVKEIESRLHSRGIEIIAGLVDDDNLGSMEFLKKCGFVEQGEIVYFSKQKHSEA